jgi:hypothetical protein
MTLKKEGGTLSIAAFQDTNIIPISQAPAAS